MTDYIASSVLLINPKNFSFNYQTFESNLFQKIIPNCNSQEIAEREFNQVLKLLNDNSIETIVFEDSEEPVKPDAIFPNNWISTHEDKSIIVYPMKDHSRQLEYRSDIIDYLKTERAYKKIYNLKYLENSGQFLEGTGSLVLDRKNKIAYAALSPRTTEMALQEWQKITGYQIISFETDGLNKLPIYHSNVMLCIGSDFAIIGTDCIKSDDKKRVLERIQQSGKKIIELSKSQILNDFAGNMIELKNRIGKRFIVMSERAKISLSEDQKNILNEELGLTILSTDINTIETVGGGSIRCMLAEIF
jgi:hypothetical protein